MVLLSLYKRSSELSTDQARARWWSVLCKTLVYIVVLSAPLSASAQRANKLNWQVLGDISARYEHSYVRPPTFILGDIDLWFQKQISSQWSGMGEIMLMDMSEGGDPNYHIHPARLFVEYLMSDALQLRIGQMHTPIGMYSQLYPHGARFFEPTIHRPLLGAVSEGEELLPLHTVGVRLQGRYEVNEHLELQYIAGVGNGNAHGGIDANLWKAPYAQLRFLPLDIEDLSLIISGYVDKLSKMEVEEVDSLYQVIGNASVYYNPFPFSLLLELFWIEHAGSFSDMFSGASPAATQMLSESAVPNTSLFGGYLQATYMVNESQSLFLLMESFTRDKQDVLLNEHTPYVDYFGFHGGHSYLFNQHVLLKTGYAYSWMDNLHRFDVQLAYRL